MIGGGWTSGWVWWWWTVDGGMIHIFLNNFISIMNSFIQPTHFSASALTPGLSVLPMCGRPIISVAVLPNGSYYTPINWPPHSSLSFYEGFRKKNPFPFLFFFCSTVLTPVLSVCWIIGWPRISVAVQDATLPSVAIVLSLLFSKDFGRKYNSVISSNQLGSPNHL